MIFTVGWLIFKPSEVFYKSFPRLTALWLLPLVWYLNMRHLLGPTANSALTLGVIYHYQSLHLLLEKFSALTNPVQCVSLFCSGEEKDEHKWSCCALTFRGDSEKSALPHRKKPAEVVQASGRGGSWTPARWGLWVGVQLGGLGEEVLGVFGGLSVETWRNGRIWLVGWLVGWMNPNHRWGVLSDGCKDVRGSNSADHRLLFIRTKLSAIKTILFH